MTLYRDLYRPGTETGIPVVTKHDFLSPFVTVVPCANGAITVEKGSWYDRC
jgi:hypothetical protein